MAQIIPGRIYHTTVLRSSHATVYLEYNPYQLPPKPSTSDERWTRFVCVSDTHTQTFDVPDGDVLLHSGDLTNMGLEVEFEKTMGWLCSLPHEFKIIIAGNHDVTLHEAFYNDPENAKFHRRGKQDIGRVRNLLKGLHATTSHIVYLQDEVYKFKVHEDGKEWSVYGSPWSPEFCDWAFNYNREAGEALVEKFPKTDILLTHGPPYGIFDRTRHGEDVGCEALRARLPFLKPRLHLFGHIHEAHGAYIHTWTKNDFSGQEEPPTVQNVDTESGEWLSISGEAQTSEGEAEGGKSTVFVNAANYPSGLLAWRDGVRMNRFGGPGFQPVVVDLKE